MKRTAPLLKIAALSVCLLLAAPFVWAGPQKVLVIDGSHRPAKAKAEADGNTRVITIKEEPRAGKKGRLGDDICGELEGRYYCMHVGKTAVETVSNRVLGKIVGVAWKGSGDVIGFYLPGGMPGEVDELKLKNTPATMEGFFYLIDDGTIHVPYFVECFRVSPLSPQ